MKYVVAYGEEVTKRNKTNDPDELFTELVEEATRRLIKEAKDRPLQGSDILECKQ